MRRGLRPPGERGERGDATFTQSISVLGQTNLAAVGHRRFHLLVKTFEFLRFVGDRMYKNNRVLQTFACGCRQSVPIGDVSGYARSSVRNWRGVTPVMRWKSTEKWLWLEQPTQSAISVIGMSDWRKSAFARSTRRSST